MQHNVHTFALEKAARILGGPQALHDYLRVPLLNLVCWMNGTEQPPAGIFLRVVDLLDADGGEATPSGAKNRRKTHH